LGTKHKENDMMQSEHTEEVTSRENKGLGVGEMFSGRCQPTH